MPHPKRRLWTLSTLDRDSRYELWFDHDAFRWEIRPLGATTGPLTTRADPSRRGSRRRPPAADAGATGRVRTVSARRK